MNIGIMTVEEFKAMTKSAKAIRLKQLRERFSDKDIRDNWGMKYDAYNYYLIQLGLKEPYGKKKEEKVNVAENQKEKAKGKGKFIDVEHEVINEIFEAPPEAPKQLALARIEAPSTGFAPVTVVLNFPSVVGTVAQLRKRIDAYMGVLELEGEDTVFEMKFVIDRK